MGYKCPKCGYERKPKDLAPEDECPKCGVFYEKAQRIKNDKNIGQLEKENIQLKNELNVLKKEKTPSKAKRIKENMSAERIKENISKNKNNLKSVLMTFLAVIIVIVAALAVIILAIRVAYHEGTEDLVLLLPHLFFLVFSILFFVLWLWALIDCAMNEPINTNDKIVWILIIIFLPLLGAILYLLVRRPTRKKMYGH